MSGSIPPLPHIPSSLPLLLIVFCSKSILHFFFGLCQTVLTSTLREAQFDLFVVVVFVVTDGDVLFGSQSSALLQVLRLSRPILADVNLLRFGILWDRTLAEVAGNRGLCTRCDWNDVREDTSTFVPTCDVRSLKHCK
jgi:hypothetical protein